MVQGQSRDEKKADPKAGFLSRELTELLLVGGLHRVSRGSSRGGGIGRLGSIGSRSGRGRGSRSGGISSRGSRCCGSGRGCRGGVSLGGLGLAAGGEGGGHEGGDQERVLHEFPLVG